VLNIYTRLELELSQFQTALCEQFAQTTDLLVLYDVQYDHRLRHFRLENRQGRLVVAVPDDCSEDDFQNGKKQTFLRKFGRRFPINDWEDLSKSSIVFVSAKTDPDGDEFRLLNLFFHFAQQQRDIFVYEVSSDGSGRLAAVSQSVSRLLRRRNYVVEKARDAERVGILVGTLGSRDYPLILERLRQTVRRAGKRCYTFLVGKPNVAKLANFPEIDVFVLVACPETSFQDTRVSFGKQLYFSFVIESYLQFYFRSSYNRSSRLMS
jgi:diphthamide biosynthesis protein 2